ncbi:hypothetical protein HBI29_196130 [Parastagonospora nodorum]|nr:hypothetical protein HBI29_196130 [Parastagonospora nodorum]
MLKELEARHSLLNFSIYNLVEKLLDIDREVKTLILESSALITPIKNNNNLLNTINSHIKLRKLKERKARLDSLLDSNNYYLDSSLDINSKNNLENKKVIIAKNLAKE